MARLFTPSESKYYLMALDAGTGSIRAVIFDLEGNQIAVGQAEWRHLAVPDVPGSMEFDLNKNWQLACECMRQALHNAGIAPEYIAAVSACSMREGIVLYNNEGAPIWACANVDARAAREVLFRALEENAAIVSACNLQQIADFSNIHPSSLVFAGGGSKGKLWSQILADVSGLPVNIPVVKEATALGCAIAAGVGAGIFSSMAETGERLVRWERTHTPDPEKHELYQDSRDKWQAVYQDQLGLVDHGLTTSLWKAPGL
ncbi:FGGY family carbohydrate kinase [Escherichia coli]